MDRPSIVGSSSMSLVVVIATCIAVIGHLATIARASTVVVVLVVPASSFHVGLRETGIPYTVECDGA